MAARRDLIYSLLLVSAVWFLVLIINLERCSDGLGTDNDSRCKRALESKEREIAYLRSQISQLNPSHHVPGLPVIYVITPTYTRPVQKAELTRLKTVFQAVQNVHWIVVEDADEKTALVSNFLKRCRLNSTHLLSVTPPEIKLKEKDPNWLKPRGVLQRNMALAWLRENLDADFNRGVVYFADDDNAYSPELFDEVVDWHTYWFRGQRPFAMDMAGFAINLRLILQNPRAQFDMTAQRGFLESNFLQSLGVTLDDLEPKAKLCTEVLVWHTRTEKANTDNEAKMLAKNLEQSDPAVEV